MPSKGKGIGLFGVIFFIISGMIGFDGLSATAAVGPSMFGWWAIIIVLFLLPNLLMISELGTAFPAEGAVYDWAHQGLGPRFAARVGWYYWINVPFWMPAVYLIAAGIIAELVYPDMPVWMMSGIAIAMVWATVFVCNASVELGSTINVLGGTSKILVLVALIVGGIVFVSQNGAATELSLANMTPRLDDGFRYAPTLVYLIVGAETVACMGSALRNPRRDIPLGLLLALMLILTLYSLAIGAMMAAIPSENLSIVGGISQSFEVLFSNVAYGQLIAAAMSFVTIIALVTYIVPWLMAASRAAAEGADAGEMPAILGYRNTAGSPEGANMMTGIIASLALLIYGFMAGSAEDLFWSLFAFASFLLFVTYFFLLAAFIALRKKFPDKPRPFRVPGGLPIAWAIVIAQGLVLAISCLVFVFPDIASGTIDMDESGPILVSIVCAVAVIEYSIFRRRNAHVEQN